MTSVLEPLKQSQLLMISANGKESGLGLSKQKVIPRPFLFGITVHRVILHSQQQISPSLRFAQIIIKINLHSWVYSSWGEEKGPRRLLGRESWVGI